MHWNWDRRFVHQVVATLIREDRRDLLHDFLVMAMSVDTAKRLLGFDESYTPSTDDVAKAWKKKALEHHPDRGGDAEMMKQVNIAHDVLTGKQRPDRGGGGSRPAPQGPVTHTPPPRTERKVTWEQAIKSAGVPTSGVDWKFRTVAGYGGYGDVSRLGFVVYGRSSSQHVFVGVYHETQSANMYTNTAVDEYTMHVTTVPLTRELSSVAPGTIRDLWKRFDDIKGYGAKVYILPPDTKFEAKLSYASGRKVSFKDAMGLMGDAKPTTWKGKLDVVLELGRDEKMGEYPATLVVNGKPYRLSDASNRTIWKVNLYRAIWGPKAYFYPESKKNLTRSKNAKKVLTWLSDHLKDEPRELMDALMMAAQKAK